MRHGGIIRRLSTQLPKPPLFTHFEFSIFYTVAHENQSLVSQIPKAFKIIIYNSALEYLECRPKNHAYKSFWPFSQVQKCFKK